MANKEKQHYRRLCEGTYAVKNQNAMYQALYDYMSHRKYSKKTLRERLKWRPITYPALVTFHDAYKIGTVFMDSLHVSKVWYWLCMLLLNDSEKRR